MNKLNKLSCYVVGFTAGRIDETALRQKIEDYLGVHRISIERFPLAADVTPDLPKAAPAAGAQAISPMRKTGRKKIRQETRRSGRPKVTHPVALARSFSEFRSQLVKVVARAGSATTNHITNTLTMQGFEQSKRQTRVDVWRLRDKGLLATVAGDGDDRYHLTDLGQRVHQEICRLESGQT